MPSPFPGMDPYLEGEEWSDVHQALGAQIRKQLAPAIAPKYIARLAIATVPDYPHQQEIEVMYPDVEIFRNKSQPQPSLGGGGVAVLDLPITKPMVVPFPTLRVRLVTVEIRETDTHRLVTSIEVLSPVNKRNPGLNQFQEKRERLMRAGVHLLDIDLIRRGKRPAGSYATDAHYLVTLTRARSKQLELWPIQLQEQLPIVAVPLRAPDADVPLDLGKAISTIYDEAVYDLSIDYRKAPPPPGFDSATQTWLNELLREYRPESVTPQ